jgi:leucyl aminopeptidase
MIPFKSAQIKLVTKDSNRHPRVIIAEHQSDWSLMGFNEQEVEYITQKIGEEKELITIQLLNEVIYIQLLNKKKDKAAHEVIESYRKAGCQIAASLNGLKQKAVTVAGADGEAILAMAEGMALGNYQFLKYKEDAKKLTHSLELIEVLSKDIKAADVAYLNALVDATCTARTLVNEPQSFLTAEELAAQIVDMGKRAGFGVEVLNKAKIKSLKMGGLLSVNLGSQNPPTFTIMEYKPKGAKNKKPLVLIGKGVVYDTGGLSLKPTPNSMDSMKCDMAGAATVASVIYGIAQLKLPYYIIGLAPATDNRPGENAYTPGDVITMMSGKTVEMLNADAEGRMILADALHYAKRYNPEFVIDLATLTGAAAAAIGGYGIVAMGTADESVKNELKKSGEDVYERLVEFPFWSEYKDLLKSDIADMKNIGGPVAGAITAGKFLEYYIDYPWMHLDIAGPAFINNNDSYRGKNGTGTGVRLLMNFVKNKLKK